MVSSEAGVVDPVRLTYMHTPAETSPAVLDGGAVDASRDFTSRSTQLGDVRRQNVALMMQTVLAHGPIARAGIAAVTGMTSGAGKSVV